MFKSYDQFNESFPQNQPQVKAFAEKLMLYAKFSPNVTEVHPIESIEYQHVGKDVKVPLLEGISFLIDTTTTANNSSATMSYRTFLPWSGWSVKSGPSVEAFSDEDPMGDLTGVVNLIGSETDAECDIVRNFLEACELYDDNIIEFIVDACDKVNSEEEMKEVLRNFRGQMTGKSVGVLESSSERLKKLAKDIEEVEINDELSLQLSITSPNYIWYTFTAKNIDDKSEYRGNIHVHTEIGEEATIHVDYTNRETKAKVEKRFDSKDNAESIKNSILMFTVKNDLISSKHARIDKRGEVAGYKLGITESYSTGTITTEDAKSIANSLKELDVYCRKYVMPGHLIKCVLPYAGRHEWDFKSEPSPKFLSILVEILGHERRKNHMVDKDICRIDYRTAAGDIIDVEVYLTDFKLWCKAYCPDNESSPGFQKLKHALEKYEMKQVPSLRGAELGARVGITEQVFTSFQRWKDSI